MNIRKKKEKQCLFLQLFRFFEKKKRYNYRNFPAKPLPNPPIMLTLRKCKLRKRPPVGSGKLQAAKPSSRRERQIAAINRRGVSHTPEYIRNDKWAHSGRMRYAPTLIFTQ